MSKARTGKPRTPVATLPDDVRQTLHTEWPRFWDNVLARFHSGAEFADRLGVSPGTVSKWRTWENEDTPGAASLNSLLTGKLLLPAEKQEIVGLWLRSNGIDEQYLPADSGGKAGQERGSALDVARAIEGLAPKRTLLVLAPDSSRSATLVPEVFAGIIKAANRLEYGVLLHAVDRDKKRSLREYYPLPEHLLGVIAVTCHVAGSSWIEDCRAYDLPLILIHDNIPDKELPKDQKIAVVEEDFRGLTALVAHLTDGRHHSCKEIRIVMAAPEGHRRREIILKTIHDVAKEHGVQIDQDKHVWPIIDYSYAAGMQLARDRFALNPKVDAVICLQDHIALAMRRHLSHIGRVDVAVTGYDESWFAEDEELTSVDQGLRKSGEKAVRALRDCAEGKIHAFPHPVPVETSFESRKSCCP